MKPGIELAWWQVHWMAAVGFWVGLPVMILAKWLGGSYLLIAAVVWSSFIFWLSNFVLRRFLANRVLDNVA